MVVRQRNELAGKVAAQVVLARQRFANTGVVDLQSIFV